MRHLRAALTRTAGLFTKALLASAGLTQAAEAVQLKPLPHRDGDRLVYLRHSSQRAAGENVSFSVREVRELRNGVPSLAGIAEHSPWALWIATSSFFPGQAKVIPEPIRITPVLVLPVLAVLMTMLYWLWRVRVRPASIARFTSSSVDPAAAGTADRPRRGRATAPR